MYSMRVSLVRYFYLQKKKRKADRRESLRKHMSLVKKCLIKRRK